MPASKSLWNQKKLFFQSGPNPAVGDQIRRTLCTSSIGVHAYGATSESPGWTARLARRQVRHETTAAMSPTAVERIPRVGLRFKGHCGVLDGWVSMEARPVARHD